MQVVRASSSGQTEDGREFPFKLAIFFYFLCFVCRSRSVSEQRRSRSHSAKVVRKSNGKSIENQSKPTKNRGKFHFRRFWTLGTVLGTRWGALGRRPGHPKLASGAILERPGRAKSGPEAGTMSCDVVQRSVASYSDHDIDVLRRHTTSFMMHSRVSNGYQA